MSRTFLVSALCAVGVAGSAAPAVAADRATVRGICGTGSDAQELVTRSGGKCATGLELMRGWRNAGNPRRYHGYRCGDVPSVKVGFARDARWFATWQCRRGGDTYRVWTAL